jgi:hypothetical protein
MLRHLSDHNKLICQLETSRELLYLLGLLSILNLIQDGVPFGDI